MATLPVGLHRLEELMKHCLETAKQLLEANGAFFPFGAVIDIGGKRVSVAVDTGKHDVRTPDVYQFIQRSMRDRFFKGEIVAGAIVAEVSIPPELTPDYPQGVRIAVESNSVSRIVFLPCNRLSPESAGGTPGPAKFAYGELIGVDVRPTLFVPDQPPQ
ncbi:MAG TPA: hypothetical protein VFT72_11640 [Opitutaceae bacterium]|nr:hypothetical protein [Opitutaceae bacterium]